MSRKLHICSNCTNTDLLIILPNRHTSEGCCANCGDTIGEEPHLLDKMLHDLCDIRRGVPTLERVKKFRWECLLDAYTRFHGKEVAPIKLRKDCILSCCEDWIPKEEE